MYLIKISTLGCRMILAVGLLSIVGIGIAQAQVAQLRAGLLFDPAEATLFMMNPAGGIDAVNAVDGSLRWHSDDGQRPISLQQGRLITQGDDTVSTNTLHIALLDPATGAASASRLIELPTAVAVSIDDSLGNQFSISGAGQQGLVWQNQRQVIQGIFSESAAAPVQQSGGLSVDLINGDITTVELDSLPAIQSNPINANQQEQLSNLAGQQFVAADRENILLSQHTGRNAQAPYQWSIYSTSGSLLGMLPAYYSRSDFVVIDDATLVYVAEPISVRQGDVLASQSLQLVAIDLVSGGELWRRGLRDTSYRGPFPP